MISRRKWLAAGAATLSCALPGTDVSATVRPTGGAGRIRLADGRWLGYQEYGSGAGPLVFYFHGTPGSRYEFGLCAAEGRNSGVRIIAVDRPGMGLSSYDGDRRITDWPRDILQLASSLGSDDAPFGIIGLSGGAPYAAACAQQIPHRLSHVALVSGHAPMNAAGTRPGDQDKLINIVTRRPRLGRLALGFVDRRLDRRPDPVVQSLMKNWTAADRHLMLRDQHLYQQLILNLRAAMRCGPAGVVKDIRLLGSRWGFCLSQIQGVGVSIWQGGCDRTVTPSMAEYFQRQIAGSELIVDPRAGHVTMMKWHVSEILSRFLL